MQDSKKLPILRMLPTTSLITHEDTDPRRVEKLCLRLRQENMLKNPPIVAPIPDREQYVVLDGANRAMAFISLGIPHIVAQVVDYSDPEVVVDTWYHVVSGMAIDRFEEALTKATGLRLEASSLQEARQALVAEETIGYIICEDGVRKVYQKDASKPRDFRLLNQIVSAYRGRADIFRASNDIWEIQKPYYPDITALVIFPRYSPEDILHAAINGYKVPSGVTRHVIPNRALNLNIPLGVLWADWPLQHKEEWLHEWLMERMASNAIRYYAESTFSFNE